MEILDITSSKNLIKALAKAVRVLTNGGLVVYPTETCYGLAVDATNQKGVDTLLAYKRRREGKPLSILVASKKMAQQYVLINDSAFKLYDRFLPGPMTVISKDKGKVVLGVASELNTLGIRISSHPVAMALVKAYGKPITATSANASFKKKPYSVDDILSPLTEKQKQKIDLILDAGNLPKREVSTVVDTTLVDTMVLREGEINLKTTQLEYISHSEDDTQKLAHTLLLKNWNKLRKHGLIIGLLGDLGVGKTVFAKGIGAYLHIPETIVSPSYTLVNEYDYSYHGVKGIMYHLDPWRLEKFEDFLKLGILTMVGKNNVVLIEWASKFSAELKDYSAQKNIPYIEIYFEDQGENTRAIRIPKI